MVKASILGVLCTQTFGAFGNMVVMPVLPFFLCIDLCDKKGAWLPFLGAAFQISQMFASPFFGKLSDKFGRKKIMLFGLTGQFLGNAAMAFSTTIPQLLLARVVCGLGMSTGPVEMAYIMDYVDTSEQLNEVLSLQKLLTSGGALAGPILTIVFSGLKFSFLCKGLLIVSFLNIVLGMILWESKPPAEQESVSTEASDMLSNIAESDASLEEPEEEGGFATLLTTRATLTVIACSMMNTFAYNIVDARNPAFLMDYFNFTQADMSYYVTFSTLATLAIAPISPKIMNKLKGEGIAVIGCFLSAIVIALPGLYVLFNSTHGGAASTADANSGGSTQSTFPVISGELFSPPHCNIATTTTITTTTAAAGQQVPWWHIFTLKMIVPYLMSVGMTGVGATFLGFGFMNCAQRKTPSEILGSLLGLNNSLGSAAGTAAPIIGGIIYGINNKLPYALSPVMFILLAGLFSTMPKDAAKEEEKEEPLMGRSEIRFTRAKTTILNAKNRLGAPTANFIAMNWAQANFIAKLRFKEWVPACHFIFSVFFTSRTLQRLSLERPSACFV
jgi:MFS family permease